MCRLSVSDDGRRHCAGTSAAADRALLSRRRRPEPSKGGTGLGLAIVKHIVARHRGRLDIETQPGQGSTFA